MKPIEELLNQLGKEGEEALLLVKETSELVAYYRRLLERYSLDALTGLPGNNTFREYLKQLEDCKSSVGIVFFDVNNLKLYNDTRGHQAGDLLLQKASESIHAACGADIKAFRIGGDEFVAVLTDCRQEDIDDFLAKWREKLAELNSVNDGIICSMAVGSALGTGEYNLSDILQLADERMYKAKAIEKSDTSLSQTHRHI